MPSRRRTLPLPRRLLAGLAIAGAASCAPGFAVAAGRDGPDGAGASPIELLDANGWRFVPLSQMLEQSQRERLTSRGMPRLLPLAMMPMQQSALWLGLSAARGDGERGNAVRIELRWSIPLDRIGGSAEAASLRLR